MFISFVYSHFEISSFKVFLLQIGGDPTPCQKEFSEKSRNWLLKGRQLPRCQPDGSYSKKQCFKSFCYCVNKYGVEIYGTRKNISVGDVMCGPDQSKHL